EPHDSPLETTHRVGEILRPPNRRRLIVASVTLVFGIFGFYGFNAFLPTLLTTQGYSIAQALTITVIFSIAPVLGALLATTVTDRYQRKNIILGLSAATAVVMVAFAFSAAQYGLLLATGIAVTLLLQAFAAILYAYLPEVFPTTLRGLGAGIAN